MFVQRPKVHPMATAALVRIQAAGVEISPEIVLWVQQAAEKIAKTPPRPVADLVDWPAPCGGALLYPLSFGAVSWVTGLPDRMQTDPRVVGFACAHARQPEVFAPIRGPIAATVAVAKWLLRLRCSRAALEAAVDVVLGGEEYVEVKPVTPRKRDERSVEWGAVVRALCTKFPGTSPEYWMWDVSREKCYAMLREINEELPEGQQTTAYEEEANVAFFSVVQHIIDTRGGMSDGG